jgi:uridine kinase
MVPFFIGITGGSGSGKTALARELKKYFDKKASIFHLDNYQKFGEKLPEICGMKNWDHPRSINWNKLLKDLLLLKKGKTIIIKSRDQRTLKKIKEKVFRPSEIIIIEGYFLFYKPSIRKLLDFSVYLKASDDTCIKRRTKFKNTKYIQNILLPMYYKYIEPTKKFADLVLNTEKLSIKQCCKKVISHLRF